MSKLSFQQRCLGCLLHHMYVHWVMQTHTQNIRVGQYRIYAPHMTVPLVISMPKIPYVQHINIWSWPTLQNIHAKARTCTPVNTVCISELTVPGWHICLDFNLSMGSNDKRGERGLRAVTRKVGWASMPSSSSASLKMVPSISCPS
jgi:hypothetical protein